MNQNSVDYDYYISCFFSAPTTIITIKVRQPYYRCGVI